ncbi:MAG TPA: lysine biosynthesis protein LysW [Candidatus Polarisedimenticolia bacterium]|nr:lysine biosynthesis protein LysW [Candidatus Polarisedimenticolia bacterium]
MGTCPECDENFDLDEEAEIGQLIECPKCRTRLEILNLMPATLDYAPAEDEA